jgi:WD40 repeat protein
MYKLSRVIHAHKRDIRCLDYYGGLLLTGGNDKVFSLYSYHDGNHALISSSDICEAEIVALRINRLEGNEQLFAVLGCRNGKIYGIDREGNPCFEIAHDSPISSIDFIDK